ncbi:hypothetical protein SERLA73DRAFT_52971 [Serpula lacrymans var. lacrymans S7.3]|uniref:Complex 1 LYR protein domain-containing protein n=1 Tax=Serpula lacrymans var. lacrymans (strain S7.3) TaxID=936435 RepID=F8PVW1_SERL3|nr:hypothetical protein SERLA73DRAFT_52971 [Serpula lacrymans var. lacrymans S7.3]
MQNLGLKHFILQKRALNLYRYVIRTSRSIPDPTARSETIAWFRGEFERTRYLTDLAVIEDKLAAVRRDIRQIFPASNQPPQ